VPVNQDMNLRRRRLYEEASIIGIVGDLRSRLGRFARLEIDEVPLENL
jgi:hypothetical protein